MAIAFAIEIIFLQRACAVGVGSGGVHLITCALENHGILLEVFRVFVNQENPPFGHPQTALPVHMSRGCIRHKSPPPKQDSRRVLVENPW